MPNRSDEPNPEGKSGKGKRERVAQPADRLAQSRVFGLSFGIKHLCSQKQDPLPTEEGHRAKFYELYRHEAEEYDREFIKRYDEDLNTTLIFVRVLRSSYPRRADSVYRPVCSLP